MRDSTESPDPNTIEAEAAEWIARLDRGGLSENERLALREWVARSPDHYALLIRFASVWNNLDGLAEIVERREAPAPEEKVILKRRRSSASLSPALALVIIGLASIVIFSNAGLFKHDSAEGQRLQVSYRTGIGEQRSITLEDGSLAQLNTDTKVNVEFDQRHRRLDLVRGEALFEIVHDESRPFLVYAGANVIHVLGTAFVVKLKQDQLELTIKEGRVELKSLQSESRDRQVPDAAAPGTLVEAGQTAIIGHENRVLRPTTREEIERKLAWREGLLVFSGEPLSYVVEEINRYVPVKFIITDTELSSLRIGGRFRIGNTAAMIEVLEMGFGVNIRRAGDDLVYLSPGPRE